jgi:signal transduction histidine kinase
MEALRSGLPVKNTMMGVFNAQQDDFVWIVVDAAPIFRRKDGAAECVFVSFSDITELLQMQRALIQSQKMEAIGRLTGGIAHDFNNILGSVLGFAELAKMRNAGRDGKLDVYLRQINIAGGRARDLVRQLLIFSRGEHTDEAKPAPMKPMLVEALRLLRPVLPMNLRIRTELSEDTPPVKIDPLHVQQLLMNLSLNARDAMRDGGVLGISLGVVRIDQEQCALSHQAIDGEWVELSVSDTGCGIPTEGRDRLFQPFYTTKGIGEGSGMGLAMVAGLVRTYQGHVLLQSEPGQGSRFRLLLPPAADVEVEADPIPAAASHARPIPDARVLVVDDDDAIRLFLSELLHNNGAEASACESAESAFELFEQSPSGFDLIISDLSMPGMDGVEFIRHVRRLDQAIKIVLCTGYADAIDEQIQEQLDIATVLLKPVDPEALLETLRSILAMSSPS